jgi:hypothetical protein
MKGAANPQPFVGADDGCLRRQGSMMDETAGFVHDEQVQKHHGFSVWFVIQ